MPMRRTRFGSLLGRGQSLSQRLTDDSTEMFPIVIILLFFSSSMLCQSAALFPVVMQENFTESESVDWDHVNNQVLRWSQESARQLWASTTGVGGGDRGGLMQGWTRWRYHLCRRTRKGHSRMAYLLCRGPQYTPRQAREVLQMTDLLRRLYTETQVCRGPRYPRCYNVEPELAVLARTSTDPAELLWGWVEWRRNVGPAARKLYPRLIQLMNAGARNNGFGDIGAAWRDELESRDLEAEADSLYREIRPLYRKLHSYVLARLAAVYDFDPSSGLIPAHLLGNLWSQEWSGVLPLVWNSSVPDLDAGLRAKNYTVWDMVRRAEDFYVSLGLERMPPKFWAESRVVKREGRSSNCHGMAANMFTGNDFRLLMCANVSWEDFHVIHHEMGHIKYFMAYRDLPALYQAGANSAFHEAVGEAIMLGVENPLHLARLGLLPDALQQGVEMPLLLKTALNKIPQLVFGLVMDKWRWKVMRGEVPPWRYNTAWWDLHAEYLGLRPPVARSQDDFDPAAKFHIMDNTPYIRYFLSGFLQMQFLEAMCIASIPDQTRLTFPLHRCDIYGSKEAGQLLKGMMSLGASVTPREALATMTKGRYLSYSAKPFLDYFQPLVDWLDQRTLY